MGSLYELTYGLELPAKINRKQFLDDLRVRNGNLAITLFESELEGEIVEGNEITAPLYLFIFIFVYLYLSFFFIYIDDNVLY